MQVQTQTITTYVANDGTSFNTPDECQIYEQSLLPLYVRLIVDQEFMYYNHSDKELHLALGEYSDQIENELNTYTVRIIHDALEMQKSGKSQDEIMVEFGLVSK